MQICMTVPIIVNDMVICEFDAAVDVKITSYGCPAQLYGLPEDCYPEEGPEWEVEATYIDGCKRDDEGNIISILTECPDELLIFVTRYIEGEEFAGRICDAIAEDGFPNYYVDPNY